MILRKEWIISPWAGGAQLFETERLRIVVVTGTGAVAEDHLFALPLGVVADVADRLLSLTTYGLPSAPRLAPMISVSPSRRPRRL